MESNHKRQDLIPILGTSRPLFHAQADLNLINQTENWLDPGHEIRQFIYFTAYSVKHH